MAMTVQERRIGHAVVLDLDGRITLDDSERLKDKVNSLLHQGVRELLLNLDQVTYIDSAGLGQLVASATTVGRQGGTVKLFNLGRHSRDLLAMTKLLTVFDSYETEEDALQGLAQAAS